MRKTFEGDLKKMELLREIHGEKEMAALFLMDRSKKRRRN